MPTYKWKVYDDSPGMSEDHKEILKRNRTRLVDTLDVPDIADFLIEKGIIKQEMLEKIMKKETRHAQVSALLDLLARRGNNAFEAFLESFRDSYDFLYDHMIEEAKKCIKQHGASFKDTNEHYYYAGIDVLNMLQGCVVPTETKVKADGNNDDKYYDIKSSSSPRQKIPLPKKPKKKDQEDSYYEDEEVYATPDAPYASPMTSVPEEENYVAVVIKDIEVYKYSPETEAIIVAQKSEDSGVGVTETPIMTKYFNSLKGYQDLDNLYVNPSQCSTRIATKKDYENETYVKRRSRATPVPDPESPPGEGYEQPDGSEESIQYAKSENICIGQSEELSVERRRSFDESTMYRWDYFGFRGLLKQAAHSCETLIRKLPTLVPTYDGPDEPQETEKTAEGVNTQRQSVDETQGITEVQGAKAGVVPDGSCHSDGTDTVGDALETSTFVAEIPSITVEEVATNSSEALDVETDNQKMDNSTDSNNVVDTEHIENPPSVTDRPSSRASVKYTTLEEAQADDDHIYTNLSNIEKVKLKQGDTVIVQTKDIPKAGHIKVHDICGVQLLIPVDCIKRYGDPTGEPWFYPINITTQTVVSALLRKQPIGTYQFYRTSDASPYQLSLVIDQKNGIKHFQINNYGEGCIGFCDEETFQTIQDLQMYYKCSRGLLPCRLRRVPSNSSTDIGITRHIAKEFIIEPDQLQLESCCDVGRGISGQVKKAMYGDIQAAAKTLQVTDKSLITLEDFLTEAQLMLELKHDTIIRCHGVSISDNMDMTIVMDLCEKRDIRQCLKKGDLKAEKDGELFLDFFKQISSALEYLKKKNIIHRDIATRNVFLTHDHKIKLGDFGMARYVVNDSYRAEDHESIPVRWAPPEVLSELKFSSKSDIYAAGVTLWEMYSNGKKPYANLSGPQLTKAISDGQLLDQPPHCPDSMYDLMLGCWSRKAKRRPSATQILRKINSRNYYSNEDIMGRTKVTEPPSPTTDVPPVSLLGISEVPCNSDSVRPDSGDQALAATNTATDHYSIETEPYIEPSTDFQSSIYNSPIDSISPLVAANEHSALPVPGSSKKKTNKMSLKSIKKKLKLKK